MKYLKRHPWNVDYKKAAKIQVRLEKSIILTCAGKNFKYIAGADVSYLPQRTIQSGIHQNESAGRASYSLAVTKKSWMFYASVVVFELKTMERVEAVTASGRVEFSYIPGLLSFRESPILLKAFAKM